MATKINLKLTVEEEQLLYRILERASCEPDFGAEYHQIRALRSMLAIASCNHFLEVCKQIRQERREKATYTDADLFDLMTKDQAERWDTTPELIIKAHELFAGSDPDTLDELHGLKGSVTLGDCVRHLKTEEV